jgi:hypothetical protein
MSRVWTICAAGLLALGCQSGEEPTRGARRGVEPSIAYQPASRGSDRFVDPPLPEPREAWEIVIGTTEKRGERDLGAELRASLGSPNECLRDFVAGSPTTIRISVSGIVRPTGMIIEPTAYGEGVSKSALDCIRERVGLVVLAPLEDTTASKSASTVFEVNYEPPVVVEVDTGVQAPDLKNVRHPLPKKPDLPRNEGIPIDDPFGGWLEGGSVRKIEGPKPRRIAGPKPRAIDGYKVDENAQDWSD